MLLLFRAHSERALGRLPDAVTSVSGAMKIFGSDVLGAQHWETAMLHLQDGDIDAAIKAFEMRFTEDGRLVNAYTRLEAVLFWQIVAERRGDGESAAILAGFADALAESASMARPAADTRVIEASRRAAEAALGAERYADHYRRGREMEWEDLPLMREAARGRVR